MECWFALGLQTLLAKVGLRLLESGLELSNIPSCLAPRNQSSSLPSAYLPRVALEIIVLLWWMLLETGRQQQESCA